MNTSVNTDDVIFNFFKLSEMEKNLNGADKLKHKDDIQSNRNHLDSLKNKTSSEWREYATQCMIEIMNHKSQK